MDCGFRSLGYNSGHKGCKAWSKKFPMQPKKVVSPGKRGSLVKLSTCVNKYSTNYMIVIIFMIPFTRIAIAYVFNSSSMYSYNFTSMYT